MPYTKIWVHLIWATKNRYPFLSDNLFEKVISHIKENAINKGIHIDFISGYKEHIHALVSLKSDQSIAQVAHAIKGESSHWINQNNLTNTKFGWQEEYIALSDSESMINKVREYIKNQKEHHRKVGFTEEYNSFLKKHGFEI